MGKLLHAEWYTRFHDKIFWIFSAVIVLFNALVFSGSTVIHLTGCSALAESMKKEIATVIIAYIYGGISLGGDFADRTLYHGLMTGKNRSSVILAKAAVFAAAMNFLLFLFPFLFVFVCSVKNGWGAEVSAGYLLHAAGVVLSLLVLGFAVSAASLLAAVCFRDVGRTIGIPVVLCFVMILLLNSAYAPAFARILPIGAFILVTDGTVSPADGMLLGAAWSMLLFTVSALVFRRAELR